MHRGPNPLTWHIGLAAAVATRQDLANMLHGIVLYQDFPRENPLLPPPTIWEHQSVCVRHYAAQGQEKAALFLLPSLINRAYILDLCKERSLVRWLTAHGIGCYLLNWGELCTIKEAQSLTLEDLIQTFIVPAMIATHKHTQIPIVALGHCMGGTLLMKAAGKIAQKHLAGLVFMASPWDFHAGNAQLRARVLYFLPSALETIDSLGVMPATGIAALFASFDPLQTVVKFCEFVKMDPQTERSRLFVATEDWLGDGCAIPGEIARHTLIRWYGENMLHGDMWSGPALLIASTKDRLVAYESATAMSRLLPNVQILDPVCGHISMIVGQHAIQTIWEPLAAWILHLPK